MNVTTTAGTAEPRRQVLPAAALFVASGAAVLSLIAIVDNDPAVTPAPAPAQGPAAESAVPSPGAAAARTSSVWRVQNLDACGRPIVRGLPICE